jgi:hypothetical protein
MRKTDISELLRIAATNQYGGTDSIQATKEVKGDPSTLGVRLYVYCHHFLGMESSLENQAI